ncbi:hypothetical protein MAPG_06291 [Magnaporthiopsis poae ATCC 64411]|uniref:Cytochrome oxidase c assembly domain-containing protein n=1 Tax=Magnaporthiopsis poae (strain ATCC 64411 / 73-15) TaxID=644358 RepID=A0A0C4E1M6_MAGP6|nr:hypothetical protein MAPG_06291 [Magnaporthiopsis poae ATCC 64411]
MASSGIRTPRSVSDATRFTPTTPHAASKGTPSSSSSKKPSKTTSTKSRPAPAVSFRPGQPGGAGSRPPPPAAAPHPPAETPEQRVARLRAAHLAAKNAQVSNMDRLVDRARGIFNHAHRFTTMGLIGLSAVATLVTVYAAVDMVTYNRKRKHEFLEAQARMRADSLEAARLAYMRGDATEEQAALVEEANERGAEASIFAKLPPVISSPAPVKPPTTTAADGEMRPSATAAEEVTHKGSSGSSSSWGSSIWGFLGGNLKEEDGAAAPARAIAASIEDKARAAFDRERENQQNGGPLDQVGNNNPAKGSSGDDAGKPKKGWW